MHLALEYLLETLFLRLLLETGWTAILRGHLSHAKVLPLAVQRVVCYTALFSVVTQISGEDRCVTTLKTAV